MVSRRTACPGRRVPHTVVSVANSLHSLHPRKRLSTFLENVFALLLAYVPAFLSFLDSLTSTSSYLPPMAPPTDVCIAGCTNLKLAASALCTLLNTVAQAGADQKVMIAAIVAFLFAALHFIWTTTVVATSSACEVRFHA